jgi:ubiquinone/menaquinone biosynthesis C-methylase UbiE
MTIDPEAFRAESREKWEGQAPGWEARRGPFARDTMPVTEALLDALALQPGETLLEVAAGTGDVGLQAAQQLQPGGRAILTDGALGMVAAIERAAQGVPGVEAKPMEAEWLDLPTASVDAIVSRWGYMLLADPETALREARRVLRPGGRIALAVWSHAADNPWLSALGRVMQELGHWTPDPPGTPGPFAIPEPEPLTELLEAAGFADVAVRAVDFHFAAASGDEWWEHLLQTSGRLRPTLEGLSPAEHTAVRDALDAALAPYAQEDGSLRMPARTQVARADA